MEKIIKQFNRATEKVSLSATEKVAVRSALVAHIQGNRVPVVSPWGQFYQLSQHVRVQYTALFLVTLIVCGGISSAAEDALPGEALYQVKTSVNENIRQLFATTPQSKAQLHVELAVRRLEEVEALVSSGKLATTTKQAAEAKIEQHLAAAKDSLLTLEQQDKTMEETATIADSEQGVEDTIATTSEDSTLESATTTDTLPPLDALMTFELAFPIEGEVTATAESVPEATTTAVSLEAELKDATATLREGASKVGAQQYTEAVALVEQVEQKTQKIKTLSNVESPKEEVVATSTVATSTSEIVATSTASSTQETVE